jgi:hypothetical protein
MHEEWANHKSKPLAIANLSIVKTETSQYSGKHLLALAIWIAEHLYIGEAAANVLANQTIVRTALAL